MEGSLDLGRCPMSYLCIRIVEFPAHTLLSLRPELWHQPVVVLEHEPPLERVCSGNSRAFTQGVRHGMTRVDMENVPGLVALRRSLSEERSLRDTLVTLLGKYTPRIAETSTDGVCCVLLDLAGTERLMGAPIQVAKQIQQQLTMLRIEAVFCICSDAQTALAVARTLRSDSVPMLIPDGQERAALAPLPLSAIEPNVELAETFALWGTRTLGQLASLPLRELIARLGQPAKRLHELATGTHPYLFRPLEVVFVLEAHADFEDPIELIDSLLFVLGPMLDRLVALVTARAQALLSMQLKLKLDGAAEYCISVRPVLPSTDRRFLLKLLQLELATHPPSAAVIGLVLTAEPAAPTREQGGLFSPQLPDASRLDVTLARIQSIVGEGNVGSAQLKDTHAPEGFSIVPFLVHAATSPDKTPHQPARMVQRMLRPPWPAHVSYEGDRPSFIACDHQRFRVKHAYGPWYSSGAWWSRDAWAREEWEVILKSENAAMPLHALLVHDLTAQAWRLEGIYD